MDAQTVRTVNPYQEFWRAPTMTEAWYKILTATKENAEDTKLTSELLLYGVPCGGLALEIGAGVGRLLRPVSQYFVWGVDISADMVRMSKQFLRGHADCQVTLGDGYLLPFTDAVIDFVYSYITFQYMPDLNCVRSNIGEIYRVLRPGGMCRVQTLKGEPFRGAVGAGGFHGYYFEDEDAFRSEFIQRGFRASVRTERITDTLGVIWLTGYKPMENT